MGRGRAKAKQTKVARELKYRSFDTDFQELEREMHRDSYESDVPENFDEDGDSTVNGAGGDAR